IGGERSPVNCVGELHAIAWITSGEADGLDKFGIFSLARHFKRDANRASLLNANVRGASNISAWRRLVLIPVHIPCGINRRRIVRNTQPYRRGAPLLLQALVIDAGEIAIRIDLHSIASVF